VITPHAQAIAQKAGIRKVLSEVLPQEASEVRKLQESGKVTAMVAMYQRCSGSGPGYIGIALGSGTDMR